MCAISLTSAPGTSIAPRQDMLTSGLATRSTEYPLLVTLGKSWWMLALRGALALLLGVLMLERPYWPLNLLVALFGIYALLDGTWAIVSALWVGRMRFAAWPVLFEGLASAAVGIFALTWPLIPRDLVLVIATWGLLTGIMELIAGFRVPPRSAGRWLLITGGVCSLFLSGLILALPHAMTPSLVRIVGAYAVIFGISLWAAALAFREALLRERSP
jgi:uncharacterized membrane protein HdeD (DUF308 family)